jgi:hypothetical protein
LSFRPRCGGVAENHVGDAAFRDFEIISAHYLVAVVAEKERVGS